MADSLLNKYINGESFDSLSKQYSLSWDEKSLGGVGPIEVDYKKGALSFLFKDDIKEGFVSDVCINNDGSFSLYLVKRVFSPSFIPYEKVYSRISSFLHKKLQEEQKAFQVGVFYKDLNVYLNDSLF